MAGRDSHPLDNETKFQRDIGTSSYPNRPAEPGRTECPILCLACSAYKTAPTETSVEHAPIPREHTFEALSISSVEVHDADDLSLKQRALSLKYQPGEQIATRVREWSETTGVWGGPQSLRLEIAAIRLLERNLLFDSYATDRETDEGVEDRLGVIAEVRENGEVVHRIDLERTQGFLGDTTFAASG